MGGMSAQPAELLSPVQRQRERYEFLCEAAVAEPELLPSLLALLPRWRETHDDFALMPWLKRFHLDVCWMWQAVRSTLNYWTHFPPAQGVTPTWPRIVQSTAYRMPLPQPPVLSLPEWEPDLQNAAQYRRHILELCACAVDKYVEASREMLKTSRGWREITAARRGTSASRRGRELKRIPQPYRWLAMRQVCGRSYRSITCESGAPSSRSSVRAAVIAAARRIELPLATGADD